MTKEQAKKYHATCNTWVVNPVTKIVPDKKKEKNKKKCRKPLDKRDYM